MKRETLQKIIRFLIRTLTVTEYQGTEHIPLSGGAIFATNHMSRLDIPVLFVNPVRTDVTALVADKYKRYSFFKWFNQTAGGIWLDRDKADFTAFRVAADVLKSGRPLGIAPEGTRSTTQQLLEGKSGTVLLAVRTGAPIVPVGIAGSESAMKKLVSFRRPHMIARFGPPFVVPPLSRENRDEELKLATEEVMCRIAALLPEQYWGFYANHPRLKELLLAAS